jgi:hypothetical protein
MNRAPENHDACTIRAVRQIVVARRLIILNNQPVDVAALTETEAP